MVAASLLRALKDSDKSSICIIRSVGGIGDVLMITPALRELKLRYPKSKLTLQLIDILLVVITTMSW